MGVILLDAWRVWSFIEDDRVSALRKWLGAIDATTSEQGKVKALFDLYVSSGDRAVASFRRDLEEEGLFYWVSTLKGGRDLVLIFSSGPGEREITFLQGAFWKGKNIRPYTAVGQARENLETLSREPNRRIYERNL